MSAYEALYAAALPARRSGPLYGAFGLPVWGRWTHPDRCAKR